MCILLAIMMFFTSLTLPAFYWFSSSVKELYLQVGINTDVAGSSSVLSAEVAATFLFSALTQILALS